MIRTTVRRLVVCSILLLAGLASAQQLKQLPPFQSYGGGPFDVVNLGSLDVNLSIPIVNKAGRGTPFVYNLSYDNFIWQPVVSGSTKVWTPANAWGWSGLLAGVAYLDYSVSLSSGACGFEGQSSYETWSYSGVYYHDTFGVNHYFGVSASYTVITGGTGSCPPSGPEPTTPQPTTAEDGSGYIVTLTPNQGGTASVVLTTIKGATISVPVVTTPPTQPSPYSSTDSNGNIVSSSNGVFTDTLGTTAISVTGSAPSNTNLTYTAPSGGAASYVVSYTSYTVRTNFGCSGVSEYNTSGVYLVNKVTLPDSTYYEFTYEPTPSYSGDVTGRIASVTFPTGGTIKYTYTGGSQGITCADGTAAGLTRQLDTATAWTYVRSLVSGSNWQTTVTDPTTAQNQTVINFQEYIGAPINGSVPVLFYETQRLAYQGSTSGTLLSTTITCSNTTVAPGSCPTTAVVPPISTQAIYNYLPNAAGSEAETYASYLFGSPSYPTEIDSYDYATGAVGPALRKTTITWGGGCCSPAVPSTVAVHDGSGNLAAYTSYLYDQTSVTTTSGTPSHVAVTNPRGNLTSITTSASNTIALYRVFTYYDTGMLNTSTDQGISSAGGPNVTTYNYSSASCGNSFSTSISEPLSLSRYFTWNCTGGVLTAIKDENSQTVSASFTTDADFWRPESTSDQLANVTNYKYTGSTTAESSMLFNASTSTVDVRATLDDFGRLNIYQVGQTPTPTSYDSVETDYDVAGRVADTTQPYGAAASTLCTGTCPKTSVTYDGLNRPLTVTDGGSGTVSYAYTNVDVLQTVGPAPTGENTKRRQLEYDGLGRLKSVCEVTSGTGSGACSQVSSQPTGYWTTYTYDALGDRIGAIQNAQASSESRETRTYTFDMLARLISELNPETGTTAISYTYDTLSGDASCGTVTSAGDLLKKVDAMGNVSCYKYDALHRVTSTTYPTGTYASSTPTKCYVYDAATVNGTAMSYAKTRLAEAYTTGSTCAATKLTDEGFSYSARGETTDSWESTPHSSGYYHLTAAYWANYKLNTLSGLPGLTKMTYGADGEGRTNTVSATSGQSPVTATSYNVAHQVTGVTYGSLDSDALTFDPNTGRMTQYQFKMGTANTTDTGVLTWNKNGSLQKLQLTDNIVSANSQTCTYGQDDMMRIVSTSCGSTWAQTFSFDPFGNLSKSGSANFGPTYTGTSGTGTSPTNQYYQLSGGSAGASNYYDSNGNLTYDVTHHYTWDADANNISVDGSTVGMTYDALDRMVEQTRGSAYTQIVYTPQGLKLALMNGQTLVNAFVKLPGGGRAVYNSSGLAYYRHKDHLGSSRLATTPTRTKYYDVAYAPYGEDYNGSGSTPDLSFTDQNQDTVSGGWTANLYDFMFREYRTGHGRWTSPDPVGLAVVDPTNPQSWNRYAYVLNNPMSLIDPFGDDCYDINGNSVPCNGAADGTVFAPPTIVNVTDNGSDGPTVGNVGTVVPGSLQEQEMLGSGPGQAGGTQGGGNSGGNTQQQQQQQQQQRHVTMCKWANGSALALGLAAGGNEVGAALSGEVSPVAAIFHGIALGEGFAGGGLAMYAWFKGCD